MLAYTAARAENNRRDDRSARAGGQRLRRSASRASRNSPRSSASSKRGGAADRVIVDPSVVRGLEYYTGPVFEAELTFEVKDEAGRPVRFGSVGGGGRYDGLVARFREEPVPATGFSVGVSRLLAALRAIDSPIVKAAETTGPVVVLALDRDEKAMASTQRLVASLRAAGIASELYLGAGGMNAQLKYADKRGSRCAVIQGSNERDAPGGPQVAIRDLKLGAELAKAPRTAPTILSSASAPSSPRPRRSWWSGCARCWQGDKRLRRAGFTTKDTKTHEDTRSLPEPSCPSW